METIKIDAKALQTILDYAHKYYSYSYAPSPPVEIIKALQTYIITQGGSPGFEVVL